MVKRGMDNRKSSRFNWLIDRSKFLQSKHSTRSLSSYSKNNFLYSKSSQLTIFIIIAIVLIAAIVLVFLLTPAKQIFFPTSPKVQLQDCVEPTLERGIQNVSLHGGSINPENAYLYKGKRREYLCFTNEYYKTCKQQRPLLRQYVERELSSYVKPKTRDCMDRVKDNLKARGYSVSGDSEVDVSVGPNSVKVILSGFSIKKGEGGKRYNEFVVSKNSDLYRLLMLSTSILNWEARYGDSEVTTYMAYYPEIKVQKLKQSDGSKIYKLENRETGDKFVFATRSLSWPSGYSVGEVYRPPQINVSEE